MKNSHCYIACLLGFGLLLPNIAHSENHEERFSIAVTENGFVRTDSKTGLTSICEMKADTLVCRASADERKALEETIATLEQRIATLEKAQGSMPETGDQSLDLPTEKQMDEAFGMIEGFMQRFFSMAQKLKPETGQPE